MARQKRILILRLSAIGDTIHTLPLVNAIKKTFPDAKIGWVVEDKAEQFVKNHPNIDKCYIIPQKIWKKRGISVDNFKEFRKIVKQINQDGYDIVFDTQQLLKSAIFMPFLKARRKVTLTGGRELSWNFANELIESSHKLFDPDYHVVKRNLEFAEYIGAKTDEIEFNLEEPSDEIKSKITNLLKNLDKNKPTVVIAPATTWKNKLWSESHWGKVLDFLDGKANIVVTGTSLDVNLIGKIFANTNVKDATILAGQTDLNELAEVFRNADVVISPDSGSAHIAWAVSKPYVITLFTATAAGRNAPFGENCTALTPNIPCHPCMHKKCEASDKYLCSRAIPPEEVIDVLEKALFNI